MSGFSKARRAEADFRFNGKSVTEQLRPYLRSLSYTDVASGESDQLDISLQNIGMEWLGKWYPVKGDRVEGSLIFHDWADAGSRKTLSLGTFTLDDISFSGGPMTAKLSCVAVPNEESFRVRERTKTWENITIQGIAQEIASRYCLDMRYLGESILIKSLEQSDQTDCAFLYGVCEDYGLSMKVFAGAIILYDQTELEKSESVTTLHRSSFVDDGWTFHDTMAGIYTGARIAYKSSGEDEEISVYLGFTPEDVPGSRVLKISETADSPEDAYRKAAAEVNRSNQSATTISGKIFPDPRICAGVCVTLTGLGKADGKYYVDRSKLEIGDSGTTQDIEMHKCQPRLKQTPAPAAQSVAVSRPYQVGDIVNFHGGQHYASSYVGSKGYTAKAGPAKITLGPDCKGNGGAHPWHLVHTDAASNVYGWVDEGTFD